MNSTDTETMADVLAEMRDAATSAEAWHASMDANVVMDFADRVETAARRDEECAVEHATRHAEAVARDNCRDCVHNPRGKNYEGGNAAAMHEACRAMNDDGDPTLCEKLKCPHYGEPNGCNSPTGEYRSVGNSAAMREALVKIYHEIRSYCFDYGAGESHESLVDRVMEDPPDYTCYEKSILEIDRIVDAALHAPARQCDVGTPEEQGERCLAQFNEWRRKSDGKKLITAIMAWAQTPYKAEEGAGE